MGAAANFISSHSHFATRKVQHLEIHQEQNTLGDAVIKICIGSQGKRVLLLVYVLAVKERMLHKETDSAVTRW